MNSTPNRKATEPAAVLIVHADKVKAHAYQQIAHAGYQKFAPAARVTKYTLNPAATEDEDVRVARADERLAKAYEQIARADEQLARVTEQLSKLEQDATPDRSAAPGPLPSPGRPALRGLIGFALAACIFAAAFVSQSRYGDAANRIIARWTPQIILTSSLMLKNTVLPVRSAAHVVAAEAMGPTPSAQAVPQEVAPTVSPLASQLTGMLQMMARDLANVEQGIEQLKTSQEQMARDNAKAIEQLKSSQEQITRDQAKAIEQIKTSQEQVARDNARAAEQLKVSQEKMAGFIAKVSKPNLQAAPPSRSIGTPAH
jgi:septal ring factor EnvC (AmiA/AmiB activator)